MTRSLLSRLSVAAVGAVLVLGGCASVRPSSGPLGGGPVASRVEANARATTADAAVTLVSGEVVAARWLHLAPDVATWLDPATGALRSARASDVAWVQFGDRRDRTVRGAVIGGIAGALLGLSAGALWESVEGGNAAATGLVGGTVVGAAVGALLGRASAGGGAPR